MTIVRVGATKKYSDGWEQAFGKSKAKKSAAEKTAAKKGAKRKASKGRK